MLQVTCIWIPWLLGLQISNLRSNEENNSLILTESNFFWPASIQVLLAMAFQALQNEKLFHPWQMDNAAVVRCLKFCYWPRAIEQQMWIRSQLIREVLNNKQLNLVSLDFAKIDEGKKLVVEVILLVKPIFNESSS